jgi:hypothetical protein
MKIKNYKTNMNFLLNHDILNEITQFLGNDDLFFYVQTCRDFSDSVNKKIYIPSKSLVFSDVKYLKWLENFKDFKVSKFDMFEYGVQYGNCDVLDYIYFKIGKYYMPSKLYDFVINQNNIDKLNWLKKNKCHYNENTKYLNSFHIPLSSPVYRWIKEELIFDDDEFYYLLQQNDYDTIDWVLKSIPRFEEDFCELAISLNDINLLNWGIEKRLPMTPLCCSRAASLGNLNILKFLRTKNCPWNEWTTIDASCNGHMEILKWAYSNGCPLDSFALVDAINNNHTEIVEWLVENKCPIDDLVILMCENSNNDNIKMCIAKFFK